MNHFRIAAGENVVDDVDELLLVPDAGLGAVSPNNVIVVVVV